MTTAGHNSPPAPIKFLKEGNTNEICFFWMPYLIKWHLAHCASAALYQDACLSAVLLNSPAFKFQLIDFLFLFAGLFFIESNLAASTGDKQVSPIGFDIIFPAMIEYAKNLDLNIPVGATNLDALFRKRELELKRYSSNSVLVYVQLYYLVNLIFCSCV